MILAARCAEPVRWDVLRLGWGQFTVVVAHALLGGVTVLTGLNPYTVAGHFLLSTGPITLAHLAHRHTAPTPSPAVSDRASRALAHGLLTACVLLTAAGTVVTDTGPHAVDSGDIARIPVDWTLVTRVHSALARTVLAVAVLLHSRLRHTGAPRAVHHTRLLLAVLVELLVGLHIFGSCLLWIAALHATAGLTAAADGHNEVAAC